MCTGKHRLSVNTDDMMNTLCQETGEIKIEDTEHQAMDDSRRSRKEGGQIQRKGGGREEGL